MRYDFSGLIGGENESRKIERRSADAETTPERRPARRIEAEKQIIYGEDIESNPVPAMSARKLETLRETRKPYLAFENPAGRRFLMDDKILSKHLLLLGGIGSGKTNVFNFLTEALLSRQNPEDIILIFDTKGDFYEKFFRQYDPGHILIGNSDKYADFTYFWNIFGELDDSPGVPDGVWESSAKEIGKQLMAGRESETQPFFALAAADLISKVLIDFRRRAQDSHDRSELNNRAFTDWLNRASAGEYEKMIDRNDDFRGARLYFGSPGQKTPQALSPQALGVFGNIISMRNDLFTGVFEKSRPGREFSMRSLVRDRGARGRRTVVFIEYDLNMGEVLNPMYSLLIDLALKEALGQSGKRKGNVIFIIDEFKLLPELRHIDDALNFGRGLGVKIFAGLQSIDQIYANYGEDRGKAIMSGFMNSFCFQTPDYNSRKYISERFGENCCQLVYRASGEPQFIQRDGHAIEDWKILELNIGEAAVDLAGQKPFLFQFSDFDRPHNII